MLKRYVIGLMSCLSLQATEVVDPAQSAKAPPKQPLRAFATKPGAVYNVGEPIKFQVVFNDEKGKDVSYVLTGDSGLKKSGIIKTGEELETVLDRPGFVMVNFTCHDGGQKYEMDAGAGVEPLKIKAGTPEPADFDAYWGHRINTMRQRPVNIKIVEAPEFLNKPQIGKIRTYDIRIEDGELNATGVLAVPVDAAAQSLPAIISFGGASWVGVGKLPAERALAYNALVFHMNIHDSENFVKDKEATQEIRKRPEISGYAQRDADQREKYRVGNVFLRIIRSLDYLKSRLEWNQKDLIAWGPSFGGAQSMVAAALDPAVTLCIAGAPAMCDHLGEDRQQTPGWPKIISYYQRQKASPEVIEAVRQNMPYFDMVNFAKRIKCETIVGVGFIDTACFPNSIYAAYNNLGTTKKSIHDVPQGNHGGNFNFAVDRKPGAFGYGTERVRAICGK